MAEPNVIVERDGRIATVLMNRPQALNALSGELMSAVVDALEELDADAEIRAIVLGGGCELAMLCDIVVASETAKFGQPEINLGVLPGAGGTQRLTRAVGKAIAMDVILTGRMLSAREALGFGLVARVVAKEAWLDEAKRVARDIAAKSPIAVRLAKEAIDKAFEAPLAVGVEFERRAFYLARASEDAEEGLNAFVEKRTPNYRGR